MRGNSRHAYLHPRGSTQGKQARGAQFWAGLSKEVVDLSLGAETLRGHSRGSSDMMTAYIKFWLTIPQINIWWMLHMFLALTEVFSAQAAYFGYFGCYWWWYPPKEWKKWDAFREKAALLAGWLFYGNRSEKLPKSIEELLVWMKQRAKQKNKVEGTLSGVKCNTQQGSRIFLPSPAIIQYPGGAFAEVNRFHLF